MDEAYEIGVRIALDNGVAQALPSLMRDLAVLDRAVGTAADRLALLTLSDRGWDAVPMPSSATSTRVTLPPQASDDMPAVQPPAPASPTVEWSGMLQTQASAEVAASSAMQERRDMSPQPATDPRRPQSWPLLAAVPASGETDRHSAGPREVVWPARVEASAADNLASPAPMARAGAPAPPWIPQAEPSRANEVPLQSLPEVTERLAVERDTRMVASNEVLWAGPKPTDRKSVV